ncbi:transposase [Amycolatopsis sp. cmx-11-12]|uniref:transposase n=1 Tax=Amycolatopsis sp. cmx-11-12 TaxID=2785795 RepID=UPI0039185919
MSHCGFCEWRSRPTSRAALRREWTTGVIAVVHNRSHGTYGAPRVHAELRLAMGIMVSRKTVAKLMRAAGPAGIPRRRTRKNPKSRSAVRICAPEFLAHPTQFAVDVRHHRASHLGKR